MKSNSHLATGAVAHSSVDPRSALKTLDSRSLRGIWSAIPTPFAKGGAIDYGILRENCARLDRAGVDGVYTTDSDGEFYALELAEFKTLAREFGDIMSGLKAGAQMGVTWVNTSGVIDRIKACVDAGITGMHVGLPFFMPLPKPDVYRFYADLAAAAPGARWIHYGHPRCLPVLKGPELAKPAAEFPDQLIGTKLNAYDLHDFTDVVAHCPQLSHFVGENSLFFASTLGARGCYSYWVNTLPRWTIAFVRACLGGDSARAREMHLKLHRWETIGMGKIRSEGYRHGIVGKARGKLTKFLAGDGSTRAPYQPVPSELSDELKRSFQNFWQEEIQAE